MYFKEYLSDNTKPGNWIAVEVVNVKYVSYAGVKKDESIYQIYIYDMCRLFQKVPFLNIGEYWNASFLFNTRLRKWKWIISLWQVKFYSHRSSYIHFLYTFMSFYPGALSKPPLGVPGCSTGFALWGTCSSACPGGWLPPMALAEAEVGHSSGSAIRTV